MNDHCGYNRQLMVGQEDNPVRRCSVEVELTNYEDVAAAQVHEPEEIRREHVRAVVNLDIPRIVLPESLAQRLGLHISGTVQVHYPVGHTANRPLARGIQLSYIGRNGIFNAIVEPNGESVLIGLIVLEDLDLIIDRATQQLVPRDPKQIVCEIE
jgi:hypothetical protein